MSDDEDENVHPVVRATTGINWKQILPVSAIPFARYMTNSMLTVMEPFMTRHLLHLHTHQIGFYSGLMIMMGFLGSTIGNATLALAAEYCGRRRVLLISCLLAATFTFLFGTAQAFWWALLARFAWGWSSGNYAVAYTLLCESSRREDRPRIFSLKGVWSALGRIIGPLAAGFLSEPATKYRALDVALFRHVPFLLPCLILVLLYLILFFSILLCVEETYSLKTLKAKLRRRIGEGEESDTLEDDEVLEFNRGEALAESIQPEDTAKSLPWYKRIMPWLMQWRQHQYFGAWRTSYISLEIPPHQISLCDRCRATWSTFRSKLTSGLDYYLAPYRSDTTNIMILCIMLLWALATQSSTAVMALILLQRPESGGFCMDSAHLGIMVTTGSAASLLVQLFLYPAITRHVGLRRIFSVNAVLLAISLMVLPWLSTWMVPLFHSNKGVSHNMTFQVVTPYTRHEHRPTTPMLDPSANYDRWTGFNNIPVPADQQQTDYSKSGRRSSWENMETSLRSAGPSKRTMPMVYPAESQGRVYDITVSKKSAPREWICPERKRTAHSGKHGGNAQWSFKFTSIAFMTGAVWALVAIHISLLYVSRGLAGTTVLLVLNNAASDLYRARLNAVGEIGVAMCSLLGPSTASVVFAWCTQNHLTLPLNHHLVFWILAYLLLCAAFVARSLSLTVETEPSNARAETS